MPVTANSLPAVFLLGATACGKTAQALALASKIDLEIISVDSALVYKGMDIGTAKPSAAERASVMHHLIDIINPEASFSAADFVTSAQTLIAEIRQRGKLPLLVGGTMLYYKALRDGIAEMPSADAALRSSIEAQAKAHSWPAMHARLATLDPERAAQLAPNDSQRIQRALELVQLTGKPAAHAYASNIVIPSSQSFICLALEVNDRALLHQRIAERFEHMLDAGFIDEVERLRQNKLLHADLPSIRAVGYRQAWQYLNGDYTLDEFRQRAIAATRQLAKRQITWQRNFAGHWPEYRGIDMLAQNADKTLLQLVQQAIST